jgi:hypothetical protein
MVDGSRERKGDDSHTPTKVSEWRRMTQMILEARTVVAASAPPFPALESKPCDAGSLPCAHHATTLRWKAEDPMVATTKCDERDLRSFDSGSTSFTLSLRLDGHSMTYVRRTVLRIRPRLVCTIDVALRGLLTTTIHSPHEISRCQLPCSDRAYLILSLYTCLSPCHPHGRHRCIHLRSQWRG